MPFDRIATLRNAVKLLRLGKLMPAIDEYVRVVQDDPRDWATANTLGDLYIRANQLDKAVEQFTRIAEGLSEDSDFAKAGALYKKILKLRPDDEHALLQAAEVASNQKLIADARLYLNALMDKRRTRDDIKGAAEIRVRLGSLDATDFEARIVGASARVELGDPTGAVRDLKEIAAELIAADRSEEAIAALRAAAGLSPADEQVRSELLKIYIASGDFARARESATTVAQFVAVAAALDTSGAADEALQTLSQAARLPEADSALKARVARALATRGDLAGAAEFLTEEVAGKDASLLLSFAEIRLRGDRWDAGVGVLERLIRTEPAKSAEVAAIALRVAAEQPDPAFAVMGLLTEPAASGGDWEGAVELLQQFVERAPTYLPALMRLIEVCVDGGLETAMYAAQAQLADAYIAAGSGAEARFIAEDLVAREPWEQGHIDRFRRALILLGEADPDKVIADRLSGESPFTSIDKVLASDGLFTPPRLAGPEPAVAPPPPKVAAVPPPQPKIAAPPPPAAAPAGVESAVVAEPPPAEPTREPEIEAPPLPVETSPPAVVRDRITLGPESIELDTSVDTAAASADVEIELIQALDELETLAAAGEGDDEEIVIEAEDEEEEEEEEEQEVLELDPEADQLGMVLEEVDLSALLDEISGSGPSSDAKGQGYGLTAGDLSDLDGAEAFYRRGVALEESGDIDGSIVALEKAANGKAWRFAASTRLGRLYRRRDQASKAIEWFERALGAGAPSGAEAREVRYDLADALESSGDSARALAAWRELKTDAGEYRDLASRIDRLTKVQARG